MAVSMVVLGAVFIAVRGNNNDYREIRNAAYILQADMRYAQRRAVTEGRRFGVHFEETRNRYHVIEIEPEFNILRTVYLNVNLFRITYQNRRVVYLPRGTGTAGTIIFTHGRYWQEITTTVGGGRVEIKDIEIMD
jgi:Tfp pilus assembly protein FimT